MIIAKTHAIGSECKDIRIRMGINSIVLVGLFGNRAGDSINSNGTSILIGSNLSMVGSHCLSDRWDNSFIMYLDDEKTNKYQ